MKNIILIFLLASFSAYSQQDTVMTTKVAAPIISGMQATIKTGDSSLQKRTDNITVSPFCI